MALFVLAGLIACKKDHAYLTLSAGAETEFAADFAKMINQEIPEFEVRIKSLGGSQANIYRVDRGELDMALVNAEEAYLGYIGQLTPNEPATSNVVAVTRLFGSVVHLLVPKSSPIQSPLDLNRTRVAIGSPGSSSAHAAKRFFTSIDMWDNIIPIYAGGGLGLQKLFDGSVGAVWMISDFPTEAVEDLHRKFPLRLIDLWKNLPIRKFYETYQFYTVAIVPEGTYWGQTENINTIQSPTLWVANRAVDEKFIYQALSILYSEKGLKRLRATHKKAWNLDVNKALEGVNILIHPGALNYYNDVLF